MSASVSSADAAPRGSVRIALIIAIAAFMQMLDGSIIGTALPQMARTFAVGPVQVGLGIVVYVLAASIAIPAAAWIADRFGARRMFVIAMGLFTLASLFCGLSRTLPVFVVTRVFQGAAGAVMGAVGQLLLVRSVDRSSLLRLMNIASVPMLVAPVLGPPLGGFITGALGWPWIFYINLPVGIAGMVLALRMLPVLPTERRPFDRSGFLLNAAALALLLGGLEGVTGPGAHRAGWAALLAGLLAAWAAVRHLRRAAHPLLSLAPFGYRTFRIATATAMPLIRLPIGAVLFVLPIMLQVGFGLSALLSGIALLMHAAGDLMTKIWITRIFRHLGYRTVLVVSSGVTAVGIGLCGFFTAGTPMALVCAVLFVAGCARSFVMTGLGTLAYDELPPALAPTAVTLNQIVIQLTSALAVALATILFDVSAAWRGAAAGVVTVEDCRNVLWAIAGLGLFAVPALLGLPRTAGDRLSGRALPVRAEE